MHLMFTVCRHRSTLRNPAVSQATRPIWRRILAPAALDEPKSPSILTSLEPRRTAPLVQCRSHASHRSFKACCSACAGGSASQEPMARAKGRWSTRQVDAVDAGDQYLIRIEGLRRFWM